MKVVEGRAGLAVEGLLGAFDQGGSGGVAFEVAVGPAGAAPAPLHLDDNMATLGPVPTTTQPTPDRGPKRLRECGWKPSVEWEIPADWPSGVYLGKLTAEVPDKLPSALSGELPAPAEKR